MTGSIQKKKDRPNYYAVLNIYDDNGKRKLKWIDTGIPTKGNNKRKSEAKLKEILVKYTTDGIDIGKDIYFTDYMWQWLESARVSLAPTTYDAYKRILDNHIVPYFKSKKLRLTEITPTHIQQYINDRLNVVSHNTVRKHLVNISKCLNSAVMQNIIAYNPVKRIKMPKKIKYTSAKHYNEKQIIQLLECCKDDPLEIVIRLTLFYGLRRSEVLGLKWDAVDFDEKTMVIKHTVVKAGNILYKSDRTKNDSSCAVFPMSEKIIKELMRWRSHQQELKTLQPNDYQDEGYICTFEDGRLISPEYVSHHFTWLLEKNNMPHIRFHDLRHSSASYLKYLGFDLKDIQTWLRHKDIRTTMNLYTHLDMEAKENIANSLDAKLQAFET
ncbi:MAG: site-specific integrase [Defluviitaleaceae bacterium]|nr:site-specific integrase [Defluviitaleaceae bacterium]